MISIAITGVYWYESDMLLTQIKEMSNSKRSITVLFNCFIDVGAYGVRSGQPALYIAIFVYCCEGIGGVWVVG